MFNNIKNYNILNIFKNKNKIYYQYNNIKFDLSQFYKKNKIIYR